ncbi:MAG: hypothetical protein ACXVJD_16040 [Mucilaginibacter sp.]
MKTTFHIIILLLFTTLFVKAQDTTKSTARPDSIIKVIPLDDDRHASYLYTIGGKLQTVEDVRARLLNYTPSAREFTMAKRDITWGFISIGGFAASGIGAAIEYATHNKHAGETTGMVNGQPAFIYQPHSLTGAYILTGVATGFLTAAIINLVKAGRHGKKALKLYNQRFE